MKGVLSFYLLSSRVSSFHQGQSSVIPTVDDVD